MALLVSIPNSKHERQQRNALRSSKMFNCNCVLDFMFFSALQMIWVITCKSWHEITWLSVESCRSNMLHLHDNFNWKRATIAFNATLSLIFILFDVMVHWRYNSCLTWEHCFFLNYCYTRDRLSACGWRDMISSMLRVHAKYMCMRLSSKQVRECWCQRHERDERPSQDKMHAFGTLLPSIIKHTTLVTVAIFTMNHH